MAERCDWCDKFPLLRIHVARVGGDREYLVCEDCWPDEEWGEFPHPKQPEVDDG